jgi:putative membrane protein
VNREPRDLDRRWVLRACAAWTACLLAPEAMARAVRAPAVSAASAESFNRVDREFLRAALRISRTDQALSRLALRQATRPHVRDFARRLAADHARIGRDVRRYAGQRRLALAKRPDEPVPARWRASRGAAFDRDYVARMYRDTREAIELFQKEAREGADLELKAYASATLPVLRAHLKLAQKGEAAWRLGGAAPAVLRPPAGSGSNV